ncbi:hypothetical protein V1264_011240 [Littorina saxatilis]|uniref:B box-type domain-containing protein n=2 Tax=Littorina saxatilis TaxID=31220 RepID=A0AAN9BV18_9CAEN
MSTPREATSRPTTQGGSRLLFTTTEESEEERRHQDSAIDGKHTRLKSRAGTETREGRRLFPIRSLAGLSEEERSRRATECSFCQGTFTEPKVFCCTRLCKKCLQSHIDISALENEAASCLVCRAQVNVPDRTQPRESWADQFRTDLFLQRLQEVTLQLNQKHDCYVCHSSKNNKTSATSYCFDCDTYYCDSCNVMHLQLRGLTSHSTATLDSLPPRDIMSRRKVFCQNHKDHYVELFCRDCNALLCKVCVDESHKKCNVIATNQIAADKKRILEGLKEEFDIAIRRAEEEDEMLRDRGSRMQNRVSQRKEEIEAAFKRIENVVAERKRKLIAELADDSLQDGLDNQSKMGQLQALIGALKDNGALAEEMFNCGSDRDFIESADDLVKQCLTLSEVTHNTARFAYDRPMSMARVDKYSVNTFLTLLTALGEDINEQVVAFKTKQIGLRMPEDKENPAIKDIQLMDNNVLLAVDNGNKCLKAIAPREGGGHKYLRLDMKTRPWGLTCMQPNVVAVSGHQCLHIITVSSEQLSLQTTVRTRKDYWSITALSPINVAGACKFPPSVDIMDITGRRLRTIEGEQNGTVIFKQPNFLATMNGNILVTDRQENTLICMDQAGEVKFVYRSTNREEAAHVRGVCTDDQNRAYIVDGSNVFMVSREGKQQCQLLTCLPDPRAISVGKDNNMAVSLDGRGVTFFTLSELKGPYN